MIMTLVFTALAALASEPEAAVVNKVLDLNDKVQMNSCQCDAAPYQVASTDRSDENMCDAIKKLASGNPRAFDTTNPYALCAPTWKAPTPEWQRPEVQRELQTYASSDFVPVTRSAYLNAKKFTVLDETARAELIAQTRAIQKNSASLCCGSDRECTETMMKVRVSVCSSPADQDPSQPDACQAVAGSYNLTARENALMVLRMQYALPIGGLARPPEVMRAVDEAKKLLGNSAWMGAFPAEGEIILSPYRKANGELISEVGTLHHEFGHACSFIKRQLATQTGKPNAEENAMSFFQMRGMSCSLDENRHSKAYGPLLKQAGANEDVAACLIDLAKQSTVETSSAYIPNSCQANKIEEATAEAFSFYTLPLKPDAHPKRACERRPSRVHPAAVDVFSCVIKADPKKRREFASKYRCQGVR